MADDWGDVNWEPDLPRWLNIVCGETKLEVEYLFGRENMVGNPEEVSRYSGGVVGSDKWPVRAPRPKSSCIRNSSISSSRCCAASFCISASKRRLCSRIFSYSIFFFSSCNSQSAMLLAPQKANQPRVCRSEALASLTGKQAMRSSRAGVIPIGLYTGSGWAESQPRVPQAQDI